VWGDMRNFAPNHLGAPPVIVGIDLNSRVIRAKSDGFTSLRQRQICDVSTRSLLLGTTLMVKRPAQLPPRAALTPDQIEMAHYGGSEEHKAERWWGGLPKAYIGSDGVAQRPRKALTTICPLITKAEREKATIWVREALKLGQMRFFDGDKDFPKRIWCSADGQIWVGYLVNSGNGEYKGWPIDEDEQSAIFG
jgi:hypothetical protein